MGMSSYNHKAMLIISNQIKSNGSSDVWGIFLLAVNCVTHSVINFACWPLPGQAEFTVVYVWWDSHVLVFVSLCVFSDQCQCADLPVHKHDRDLYPLSCWGLPETSLPGDEGIYPGQIAPAEGEPAAGTHMHTHMHWNTHTRWKLTHTHTHTHT